MELGFCFTLVALALAVWEGYKHDIKAKFRNWLQLAKYVHASRGK